MGNKPSSRPRKRSELLAAQRTYAGSAEELLMVLHLDAEWPRQKRATLAQRARRRKHPSKERNAAAHDVIQALAPDLSRTEPLQVLLNDAPHEPRPQDRRDETRVQEVKSSRLRITLIGRLGSGEAFKLQVSRSRTSRRAPGFYKTDSEGEKVWVAGRVTDSFWTHVEIRLRIPLAIAQSVNRDELLWLASLPPWTKKSALQLEEDTLVLTSQCSGLATPQDLAEWLAPALVALAVRRKAPAPAKEELDPEVVGLFQNLVLAVLVDGHLDPSEVSFLSSRAQWLGLSTGQAQHLAAEVTSGQVTEFYRPEDPVACRVNFRQAVEGLHADGALEAREQRLIRFLGRGLGVNQGDIAQALGEVPPGADWAFLRRSLPT